MRRDQSDFASSWEQFRFTVRLYTIVMLLHKLLYVFSFAVVVQCVELDLGNDETKAEAGQPDQVNCPEEVLNDNKYGIFVFPETRANKNGVPVRVDCPHGFRNEGYVPIFGDQNAQDIGKKAISGIFRVCYVKSSVENDGESTEIGTWVPALDKLKIRYCKQEGWDEDMEKWLGWVDSVTADSFMRLGPYTTLIMKYAMDDYDCAVALVNGIAGLLTSPALDGISQDDRNRLFNITENYCQMMSTRIPRGYKFRVGDAGIIVETVKFDQNTLLHFGSLRDDSKQSYMTHLGFSENTTGSSGGTVNISISSEALYMATEQNYSSPQLTITAYSHEVFRQWSGKDASVGQGACLPITSQNNNIACDLSEEGCEDHVAPVEAWGLLCIELDGDIENLHEPVEFILSSDSTKTVEGFRLTCVYWDETEQIWSTSGLTTTLVDNGIQCASSHLTAFSALLEPLPLPFPGAEYAPINNSVHSYILSILSSIGSVCSIVGLSLTLFTYSLFSSLRRERSNRILINLCSSLLLLHIMSVSGSKSLWDGYCFVPAVSLHYLVLTSLAWMMVEAVHMFDLLISVFVRPESRFLIKRFVLAWGIPLIIVGICAAVDPKVYLKGRADLCLMNAHENIYLYYGAYIFPLCLMLLVNLIIFCRIFRVLYKQTKRTNGMTNVNKAGTLKLQLIKISPLQIKGATSVMVLLGIGWILGLVAIGPFEVFFRYMYCVVNAGQGLLIFIFRVALNPHACKQWKKVMLGLSPDSSLDVSITTSSTASDMQRKRKSTANSLAPNNFISAASSVENSLTVSNPMSKTLATALASILKSENEKARATEPTNIAE